MIAAVIVICLLITCRNVAIGESDESSDATMSGYLDEELHQFHLF